MNEKENMEKGTDFADKIKKAANIAISCITAVLVVFLGYIMICSARGKAVSVFGSSVLTVVTGSMEPSLHVGDYIIVKKTPPEKLLTDDIISFYSEDEDIKGKIVTHRIVGRDSEGNFITKGDANNISDHKAVRPDQIVGKYVKKGRFFMWLNSFADRRKLLMIAVIIPMTLIALYEVRNISRIKLEYYEEKKAVSEEEREKLIREAIDREKERLAREGLETEAVPSPDAPQNNNSGEEIIPESEVKALESGKDNETEDV